jgi:hypothetical protein
VCAFRVAIIHLILWLTPCPQVRGRTSLGRHLAMVSVFTYVSLPSDWLRSSPLALLYRPVPPSRPQLSRLPWKQDPKLQYGPPNMSESLPNTMLPAHCWMRFTPSTYTHSPVISPICPGELGSCMLAVHSERSPEVLLVCTDGRRGESHPRARACAAAALP